MKELMFIVAEIMPMEEVIEKINELSQTCKLAKTEDKMSELSMYCMMFLVKDKMNRSGTNCMDAIKEFDLATKGMDLLRPKPNN